MAKTFKLPHFASLSRPEAGSSPAASLCIQRGRRAEVMGLAGIVSEGDDKCWYRSLSSGVYVSSQRLRVAADSGIAQRMESALFSVGPVIARAY